MTAMPPRWKHWPRRAVEPRGTATIPRGAGEGDTAVAIGATGRGAGIEPRLDRAPADGERAGLGRGGGRPPAV